MGSKLPKNAPQQRERRCKKKDLVTVRVMPRTSGQSFMRKY